MATVGLVLAAGEGKRFGGPKAAFEIDGERLVDRAIRILHEAGISDVAVVLGAWVSPLQGADVIVNPEWATGMGSSLRAGLASISGMSDADRVVVTLVDLPGLTPAAVRRVALSTSPVAMATYHADRGHPVAIAREHWDEVARAAEGDTGAKAFIAAHPDLVELVECADIASGQDMDVRPD